jgi:hypothetical protein
MGGKLAKNGDLWDLGTEERISVARRPAGAAR